MAKGKSRRGYRKSAGIRSNASPRDTADRSAAPRGPADRLVLAQADEILPGKALLVMLNGSALARHLTNARPDVAWSVFTFEHFYLTAAVHALSEENSDTPVALSCHPDLPDEQYDTVLLATDARASSELARDVLQSIANRLTPTGRLIVSVNNPRDHWLQQHLKETYGRITAIRDPEGACYIARRRPTLAKQKNFDAEFAFRDGETLIACASRPGVFSHRRVDAGARALIRSLNLLPDAQPEFVPQRIVEMGCGCGSVTTAAALRYPESQVIAVDSHARAVQSTERTAALNDAHNVAVLLTSGGDIPGPGTHDLFLCNPPYYSDYRISELFLDSAEESLRQGGRIHLVTKQIEWHHNRMLERFANADVYEIGEYHVVVSVAY